MIDNRKNLKFICGIVVGIFVGSATVVGANQAIQAIQNSQIKINLNGIVQEFRDETTGELQLPLTFHNRTYLPLRNVAQLSGLDVDYDNETNTAILKYYNRYDAYYNVLKNYYYNKTLPNGKVEEWQGEIEDDKYVIFDIDNDGKEELIIKHISSSMAGMFGVIYGFDEESQVLVEKYRGGPNFSITNNGYLFANISHNQGTAFGFMWPFTIYKYNREINKYEVYAYVDGYDKNYPYYGVYDEKFPEEYDLDGNGGVYEIQKDNKKIILDDAEYEKWYVDSVGEFPTIEDGETEDYTFKNFTEENVAKLYENSQKIDTTLQYSPVGSEHQIWLVNKFSEVTKGDIINSINEISIKDNNYYIVNAGLDDNGYTLLFDSNGNEVKDTINKLTFREFLDDEIISFGDKEITLKTDRFEGYNICVLDSGYILCIPINEGNSLTQMEILNSNLETIYISGIDKLYDLFYINDGILIFSNNVQQYDSEMQLDTYIKVTYKLDLTSLKTTIIETSTKIRGPAGQC